MRCVVCWLSAVAVLSCIVCSSERMEGTVRVLIHHPGYRSQGRVSMESIVTGGPGVLCVANDAAVVGPFLSFPFLSLLADRSIVKAASSSFRCG